MVFSCPSFEKMTQVRGECNQITVPDMVMLLRLMRMLDNHAMLQFESGFWTFTETWCFFTSNLAWGVETQLFLAPVPPCTSLNLNKVKQKQSRPGRFFC